MLLNLHVKNVALIDEADVSLGEGLNVLTGETGAGKSILIDAVNLALGARGGRSLLREGGAPASVELLFQVSGREKLEALKELEVFPDEEGMVLISRRVSQGKSVCRINDETVTAARLRAVTALLIDIHGQHEHQSLLHKEKHLEILDAYCRYREEPVRRELVRAYGAYAAAKKELSSYELDEDERKRELSFLEYEISELSGAGLKPGEIPELEGRRRRLANGQRIASAVGKAEALLSGGQGAGELLGRAARELSEAAAFDEGLSPILSQATDAEALLEDLGRALRDYGQELSFDQGELSRIENRLDVLHGLQAKYGETYEEMMETLKAGEKRREILLSFDEGKRKAKEACEAAKTEAWAWADKLSAIRKEEALHLTEAIRAALVDLNFMEVQVSMEFSRKEEPGENGFDEAELLISTNPGEALKPLAQVASGGELSRIMLAVKAVLADTDEIDTLIFDEIDAGISGRTAQKVAEKLNVIGRSHQVICITHLPQIAAMADCHYKIEKSVKEGRTITTVESLDEKAQTEELARLLGGAAITGAVRQNAAEMKRLASEYKKDRG